MPRAQPLGRPPRLLPLFAGATLVPAVALAWLGWAWLDADRRLERERVRELLQAAAVRVSAVSERARMPACGSPRFGRPIPGVPLTSAR
jgi:hypothetical protein